MKRFIDLKDQIIEGNNEFAFYCTVKDRFEVHGGNCIWETVQDFTNDYQGNELNRYLLLIPSHWPEKPKFSTV